MKKIKGWEIASKVSELSDVEYSGGAGTVFIVGLYVTRNCSLLRIGAGNGDTKASMMNQGQKNTLFVARSPMHYNFWGNSEILIDHYQEYRIPRKPYSHTQMQLFNISRDHFFKTMPKLHYAKSMDEVRGVVEKNYPYPIYYYKGKD